MTDDREPRSDRAEDRLAHLIDRLLIDADSAASGGAWDRVTAIADDILAVVPDNQRAAAMLVRARNEQSLSEGQRAFVSLIFSDIVESTDLADVTDPEIVRDLFKVYRRAATEAIEGLGGTVLQFQGDGIVACFGYPNAHEDDAIRAVLAGLELVERMAAAGPGLRRSYGIDAAIRVGIHTGTVVVAGLTSGVANASDIVGAAANIAARLQGEAEAGTVVVSDATRQLVETHFEVASVGTRALKGISRPVEVFRVVRRLQNEGRLQPVSLVGREVPRGRLRRSWDEVIEPADRSSALETAVVILRGPAGIGKSRLAADLCEHVRAGGGAILQASCSAYHANVALWPIGRMLEHRLGLYPEQPSEQRVAAVEESVEAAGLRADDVVPLIAPLLGLEVNKAWTRREVDALALRAETLNALVDWLARFARATPTLIVVEDLHWADPSTVDLIGLLARGVAPGVMVLITTRELLTTPWATRATDIELDPLRGDDAAKLVAAMVADGNLNAEQCDLIIERGSGVPLFIQELARSALTAIPGETLPPRLQELFTARLRAPGIDLRVAQLAATLGSVFDGGLLRELAGSPVIEALAQLEAAGIVERVGDARRGGYGFRHVLLRDAAYETQVLDARRAAHDRIARLMRDTATAPGDMAIVAQHHDLAGDVAQSIPAYIAAAQAAQAEASHSEARRLLDRAIELLAALPEGDERDLAELAARMFRTISVSSLFGYGYPDVLADFQLADRICRRQTDRPEILPAQIGIWSYMLVRGELDAAGVVLEPLMASVDAPETAWFAPEIRTAIGFHALYRGELESARAWLEEAWAGYLARPADAIVSASWPLPHDPVPVTAVALACIAGLEGHTAQSAEWESRALATAEKIGFLRGPFSSAFVTTYLAWLRMIAGDAAGARGFGQRTMDTADQCRFAYFTVIGRQYVLAPEPGLPAAAEELEQCEAGMDLIGHGAFRPFFLGVVARNHAYLGDYGRALERVNDALSAVEKSGEWVHQPDLLRVRAEITAAAFPTRMEDAAHDLLAAVEVGLAQGSLLLALRSAITLARLPVEARPAHWRDVVRTTLDRFPEDSASPELAAALTILGD
ncbi:MAG: AAA family ATPase [Actinomycetota bacterium]|nr:AAA family ATPase [Actinomycetota bacterium]